MFNVYFKPGNKKTTRLFWRRVVTIFSYYYRYIQLPPPLKAGMTITTTMTMAEKIVIALLMLLNIRSACCNANIHPPP